MAKPRVSRANRNVPVRMAPLAEAVRSRRHQLGLRQDELAELAGVSTRFVHMVEAGKATVQTDKLLDLLEAVGLHLQIAAGGRPDLADAREHPPLP